MDESNIPSSSSSNAKQYNSTTDDNLKNINLNENFSRQMTNNQKINNTDANAENNNNNVKTNNYQGYTNNRGSRGRRGRPGRSRGNFQNQSYYSRDNFSSGELRNLNRSQENSTHFESKNFPKKSRPNTRHKNHQNSNNFQRGAGHQTSFNAHNHHSQVQGFHNNKNSNQQKYDRNKRQTQRVDTENVAGLEENPQITSINNESGPCLGPSTRNNQRNRTNRKKSSQKIQSAKDSQNHNHSATPNRNSSPSRQTESASLANHEQNSENEPPTKLKKPKPIKKVKPPKIDLDSLDQRSRLIHELTYETYECMICVVTIKKDKAIWTCETCRAMFHIYCVKKWATMKSLNTISAAVAAGSDNAENVLRIQPWPCPGCNLQISAGVPSKYSCFCGKLNDPTFNVNSTPHSCGDICHKKSPICEHLCPILCHPGPCQVCPQSTLQICPCDEQQTCYVKCADLAKQERFTCGETCGRVLNCQAHFCDKACHFGRCPPCPEKIEIKCHSHNSIKTASCGTTSSLLYTCNKTCGKALPCGHTCKSVCHSGDCPACLINENKNCHCGKEAFPDWVCTSPRSSCLKTCNKKKVCGHNCKETCHPGDCHPCDSETMTQRKCSCGKNKMRVSCEDLVVSQGVVKCSRICKKVADCGNPRHLCGQECCVDDHPAACVRPCGAKLSCSQHICPEMCHYGRNCLPCPNVIWHELSCHCGDSKILPPIACGSDMTITCHNQCPIERNCRHKPAHSCHDNRADCPPCTALVAKPCVCQNQDSVKTVCYRLNQEVSCGKVCGKLLFCGHFCQKVCHDHDSYVNSITFHCSQPCKAPRSDCGHICSQPCHNNEFEEEECDLEKICRIRVKINCDCGFKNKIVECGAPGTSTSSGLSSEPGYYTLLKNKQGRMQRASKSAAAANRSGFSAGKSAVLLCDEDCDKHHRLMGLRAALEISDIRHNITFEPWMIDYTSKNLNFVSEVEENFNSLICNAVDSKEKYADHMFKPMPKHKRKLIHELAALYGLEGVSYNVEPYRYCHIFSARGAANLPKVLLTHVVTHGNKYEGSSDGENDLEGDGTLGLGRKLMLKPMGANEG